MADDRDDVRLEVRPVQCLPQERKRIDRLRACIPRVGIVMLPSGLKFFRPAVMVSVKSSVPASRAAVPR